MNLVRSAAIILRGCVFAIAALSLAGCVESAEPILTDAKPVFGLHLKAQMYSLDNGRARDPAQDEFTWDGKRYVASNAELKIPPFNVHPVFGTDDFIIQSVPSTQQQAEYGILHKLADGVFLFVPIDAGDSDEATRKQHCVMIVKYGCATKQGCIIKDIYACRIKTREQLMVFAHATAAKNNQTGSLVILLADEPAKK